MVKAWEQNTSELVSDFGLFGIHRIRTRSPRTDAVHDFLLLQMVDWLQVLPITHNGEIVLVRQFRHGSGSVGLELPGGLLDEVDGEVAIGAQRELLEETGYGEGAFQALGNFSPQPALFTNRVHLFLAQDVKQVSALSPDAGEDIEVELVRPGDLNKLIQSGQIENAITLASLTLARCSGHLDDIWP